MRDRLYREIQTEFGMRNLSRFNQLTGYGYQIRPTTNFARMEQEEHYPGANLIGAGQHRGKRKEKFSSELFTGSFSLESDVSESKRFSLVGA